jgi:hypothetical protein
VNTLNLSDPILIDAEHRGWKLRARWLKSTSASTQGWVCYATRPTSAQELNIGRWLSSEVALQHGRDYVDRQVDSPIDVRRKPNVLKRRL